MHFLECMSWEVNMEKQYDVIVVGTGISGLFCALHLPDEMSILMITKTQLEHSNSFLAQGGICVLKNEEDFDSYVEDTMRAGRYENNRKAVELMISSSPQIINELIRYQVEFDTKDGELLYTREAAHSTNRILHHADTTGKEISSKLLEAVKQRHHIEVAEYCEMVDLMTDTKRVLGIIVFYNKKYFSIKSKAVVLATGGIGGLFPSSTNYSHITGDSIALALKYQIEVEHINYVQIHPTTLYSPKRGRRFLISEAVRGEGAYLLNEEKKRFVDELLPRDEVSRIIEEEMQKNHTDHVYLSLKHLNKGYIQKRFPNIYRVCLEAGYDLIQDDIPVVPAQHYFMGGIKVDLESRTGFKGLYAVGETSCTGVHGANRLASNSLLEGLVFSKRAAEDIIRLLKPDSMIIGESSYQEAERYIINTPVEVIHKEYQQMVLNEIKTKDSRFYETWFHQ